MSLLLSWFRDGCKVGLKDTMSELLVEDLAHLQPPGGRVVYTCVDASPNFVAFGANSGSVYVHSSTTMKLLVIVPVASTDISRVQFNATGEMIAASAGKSLSVLKHCAGSSKDTPTVIVTTAQHEGAITSLAWDDTGSRVFTGGDDGVVSITKVPAVRICLRLNSCMLTFIHLYLLRFLCRLVLLSSRMSHHFALTVQ